MPKKKRTRKDKIQTDLRRESSSVQPKRAKSVTAARQPDKTQKATQPQNSTFSLPQEYVANIGREAVVESVTAPQNVSINTSAYKYLRGDLLKTTTLTTVIIAAELFIYFFWMK